MYKQDDNLQSKVTISLITSCFTFNCYLLNFDHAYSSIHFHFRLSKNANKAMTNGAIPCEMPESAAAHTFWFVVQY